MEMNENTISDDMTMGGAAGTLLANRYRVIKQLGQGGMGSVWLAEDTKLDGYYWSSTPSSGYFDYAWYLYFTSCYFDRDYDSRYLGQSVRPVRGFAN